MCLQLLLRSADPRIFWKGAALQSVNPHSWVGVSLVGCCSTGFRLLWADTGCLRAGRGAPLDVVRQFGLA